MTVADPCLNHPATAPDPAASAYDALKAVQRSMGLQRLRLGALLCVLEDSGEWAGRTDGSSFRRFLVEEGIEPKAASQYMRVARVFVLQLQLPVAELRRIGHASMRVLASAADIATPANVDRIIDLVATLPRPEALDALKDLVPAERREIPNVFLPDPALRPVGKILDAVGNLTFEQKAALYRNLGKTAQPMSL
ncbi:hypothetical protein ACFS07_33360 [Undibacterium arcticum]